jgi:AcrR family transcriptional regulator
MTQQDVLEETVRSVKRSRSTTEGRLLRAGLEVFAEMGFDAATTRMIAHRAAAN